ncbi:DNA-directed RNA polymerase I, II, and III subunit RPABC4 [Tremella mesenterica]|uniref:DNA-directed RNA polymerase I, II, and III subunit RPABC4 n=1 Tax=Tremella mesenterica TaxID=5217 RepID=A0A4Q1BVF6_TREME|nr:DNA-directed RNA polymerase I, II, and III subunit RPABC4 [Tremella mesenterica]
MSESQQDTRWQSQNPNPMAPRPSTFKAPDVLNYLCADCGAENGIKSGENIRCKECGHRVLYKPRTYRIVQFEAR